MKLPIVLRLEAQVDFDNAFDWYEARRPGLGAEFAGAVQKVFDRIAVSPLLHQTVLADIRRGIVRRFPFGVYYRTHKDRIEVLAVFHSSREPAIWQARV